MKEGGFEFRCVRCSYVLRGLTVDAVCPECGTPVSVSMRSLGSGLPTSGKAIASLVCGVVALPLTCTYVLGLPFGIAAVVLGEMATRQVKRGEVGGGSIGMAIAGRICGWISIAAAIAFIGVMLFAGMGP